MTVSQQHLDGLRARIPVSSVVGRWVKLTRKAGEFSGLCPFHSEKTPSFTVNDKKAFYHCFGCGAHGDVIRFVMEIEGLDFPAALEKLEGGTPEREAPHRRSGAGSHSAQGSQPSEPSTHAEDNAEPDGGQDEPVEWMAKLPENFAARYVYHNAKGKIRFVVQRYYIKDKETGLTRKWPIPYTRARNGEGGPMGWVKGMLIEKNRPLYGLLGLLAADPARQVMVVEGEKCKDMVRIASEKTVAVSWQGGTNSWGRTDWSPLRGRTLLLVSDGNIVGHKTMFDIAALLNPHCPDITIVLAPVAPKGEKALDIGDEIEKRRKGVPKWLRQHAVAFDPARAPRFERVDGDLVYAAAQPPAEEPAEEQLNDNGIPLRLPQDLPENDRFRVLGTNDHSVVIEIAGGGIRKIRQADIVTGGALSNLVPDRRWWGQMIGRNLDRKTARAVGERLLEIARKRGPVNRQQ